MPNPPLASFTGFDVTDTGSIASLFAGAPAESLCGIYVLRFREQPGHPSEAYVGQAVNVVRRFAAHRRRWSDIVRLEFAPCALADLNDIERRTVDHVGRSASLRNLLLTDRPGGWGELRVALSDARSIALPWERERRRTLADGALDVAADGVITSEDDGDLRFALLREMPEYPPLREFLGRYVHETVPDPAALMGVTFSMTALPSTRRSRGDRRLVTANCGVMETAFVRVVTEERTRYPMLHLNVQPGVRLPRALKRELIFFGEQTYRHSPVTSIVTDSFDVMDSLLACDAVLDSAYQLNVLLLRRGARNLALRHNSALGEDVLSVAARVAHSGQPESGSPRT